MTRAGEDLKHAAARKGSFVQTFKAVAWSFFGVRKASEYEKDITQLNPLHVVVAGIVAGGVFVLALVMLVKWVVGSGVAG